ncbi:hypothetical protein GCK72_021781 [Caenorhabditis remanei]|uniref:Major facilitator superfamily (MFS) profile domain-containing protein n=1 Tax=Caenorhabditis remanei TaxID=31234 RepID=A0A6A5GL20_CAERE|nr:hypothetical protein GCK72_021781 [Caenorhabditis remanei]KAF1755212.1 hypothetical protein GCK72_021781 [Caenorhabditis remanei]
MSSSSSSFSQLSISPDSNPEEDVIYEYEKKKKKRKVSKFVFGHKTRLYIMVLLLLCLTLPQMNSITFNFTVICMGDLVERHQALNRSDSHWMSSPTHKSFIFSSTAIGAVIGLIPSVPLIDALGIRVVLTVSGVISAVGSIFFPLAADFNYYAVILCRVLQGLGISILFTVVGVIPGVWAPRNETGTFLAILSCAFQLSMIICMPISGILCETPYLGWRSIYYIFGAATLLIYTIFFTFYTDSPRIHRNVSEKELKRIESGKLETPVQEGVPYWAICSDVTVLAAWLSVFGGNFGFTILTLYGPTYLKDVLHFDVKETGFATALPFILSAVVKFAAGRISDKMDHLSEKTRFTFCAVVSQASVVLGLVLMAMTSNRRVAQFAYTFAITSSGLNIVGNVKCIQLRCRQHVHFAITVISFCAYLIHFGAPIVVGWLTSSEGDTVGWSRLFIIVSVITVLTNLPFPFLTSEEPAPFVRVVKVEE